MRFAWQGDLGQGSFARVFIGIDVEMVQHNASLMFKLSHLGTPLFFGVNVSVLPYHIVMQLCTFERKSVTVRRQLLHNIIEINERDWAYSVHTVCFTNC